MSLSPWHGAVMTAAAVVSAPASWAALVDGTLPVADALSRFLLCVGLCWVALNVAMPLLAPARPQAGALPLLSEEPQDQPLPDAADVA